MDPQRFDALSRSLARGVSRRRAVARLGAGGLAAGLAAAVGRGWSEAARPAAQAPTCRLGIVANVRLGPSAGALLRGTVPGELRGDLEFAVGEGGAVHVARLRLGDGTELPVVGQVLGHALHLRVEGDQILILVGTASRDLGECTGGVDGLLTGPLPGDLGDWHATATALATAQPTTGPTTAAATATTIPGQPRPANPTATGAASTATGTAPAAPTGTGTAAPTTTPSPEPTHTATPEATATATPTATPAPTTVLCGFPAVLCDGVCVNTLTDPANCGACGNVCPPGQPGFVPGCTEGVCFFMRERAPECEAGLTRCGGVCVDPQTDAANCGGCGVICPVGTSCFQGTCAVVRDHRCDPGFTNCGDVCVDTASDPANCGACGTACAEGETCFGGLCARDHRNP